MNYPDFAIQNARDQGEAMSTTTESLPDTLRDLSELLPETFQARSTGLVLRLGWTTWPVPDPDTPVGKAVILAACLEECRERGYGVEMDSIRNAEGVEVYRFTLTRRVDGWDEPPRFHSPYLPDPAGAIAAALLEAIKNERGGAEK